MSLALLNPEKALIFRITHIDNLPWILDHGLHCRNSEVRDPTFRSIGNPDLIAKREHRRVMAEPRGTLSDYVSFYFTPLSPMLLNIKTGHRGMTMMQMPDIVIIVASVRTLAARGLQFVLFDRHAYLEAAVPSTDLDGLDRIDWRILQARDFKRSPDDPGKLERYQAEALVHRHVPVDALTGLMVHGEDQKERLACELNKRRLSLKLTVQPGWYF